MANFQTCWALLLKNEGGFVVDNGGATRWGITEAVARRNGYAGDMIALPQATAMAIAQSEYWLKYGCDKLPTWAAFQVLDTVYNGGPAVSWLQYAVGVAVDGNCGPATIAAVAAANPWKTLCLFNERRLEYFAALKQPQYSGGRFNRIAINLTQGEIQ